ncbi:hypothetical protein D3C86_1587810 [compost metagenome]
MTVHDDGVHGRVGGRLLEGLQQLGTHGLAECIDRRVRQADQGHLMVDLIVDQGTHGASPCNR